MMGWSWPAWAVNAWAGAQPYVEKLYVWRGYEKDLQGLLIYAVGIALYTALVFAFYQNICKKNAFEFVRRPGWKGRMLAFLQSGLLFPLMSFLYFAVLALSLFVLAKSQGTSQLLTLSMAVVLGVRVTAFVSENASVDLAKMLPLSLLGVLLVDPSYASLGTTWARVQEIPGTLPLMGRYFLLFIVVEGALRVAWAVARRLRQGRSKRVPVLHAQPEARATLARAPVADLQPHAVAASPPTLALDEADVS
jgi:hypothetical protein